MAPAQHPTASLPRDRKIFCFGFGYTAVFLGKTLAAHGWRIAGTTTDPAKRDFLRGHGIEAWLFDRTRPLPDPARAFDGVTHVLLSVPPDAQGDPVCDIHGDDLARLKGLAWAGYLSTTAVYGNQDGNWIDETVPPAPDSRRGSLRLRAEQEWQSLYEGEGLPLHIFRLSGIYGPGRSALDAVRSGTARRIDKPGHVFNRIHIDDIVQVLAASISRPRPGGIYNLADDAPAPSHEVISYACALAGVAPPPLIPFDQAEMAPIVRSFYKDNKRVRNTRIKEELGVRLRHPDYRSGIAACLAEEKETPELLAFSAMEAQSE